MQPFRLEAARPRKTQRRAKIIYTKNAYSEKVKVEKWQEILEHHPVDVDPYCQGKVNYFLSHYHRFGAADETSYRTTTGDMLDQAFIKPKTRPSQIMNNYYTLSGNVDCQSKSGQKERPMICANDFVTTMQHSFQVPKPYVMHRLAFPKIPVMKNRKYKHDLPEHSSDKFYDEDFEFVTCQLRKHKGSRSVSFNPMTGTYTNVQGMPTKSE